MGSAGSDDTREGGFFAVDDVGEVADEAGGEVAAFHLHHGVLNGGSR